jgi:hypothetical protein
MLFEGRWQPPELPEDSVEALIEENRTRGIEPDWRTAGARWKREEDIRPRSGSRPPRPFSEHPTRSAIRRDDVRLDSEGGAS